MGCPMLTPITGTLNSVSRISSRFAKEQTIEQNRKDLSFFSLNDEKHDLVVPINGSHKRKGGAANSGPLIMTHVKSKKPCIFYL